MVITDEGTEVWTKDDYFMIYSDGSSVACVTAQDYVDEASDRFDEFIKKAGMHKTHDSEWSYSCQCNGTHIVADNYWNMIDAPEIFDMSDYACELWCDNTWVSVYERHYPRIHAMYEWLRRTRKHLVDAPMFYHGFFECSYVRRRDTILDERRERVLNVYKKAVEDFCDELAREYDKLLKSACDYAYSDEVAQEWADSQNERII